MGEKIKILSSGHLNSKSDLIEFELNHPTQLGGKRSVHVQSKKFRIEMSESDFIKLAATILVAELNLKSLKNIDE